MFCIAGVAFAAKRFHSYYVDAPSPNYTIKKTIDSALATEVVVNDTPVMLNSKDAKNQVGSGTTYVTDNIEAAFNKPVFKTSQVTFQPKVNTLVLPQQKNNAQLKATVTQIKKTPAPNKQVGGAVVFKSKIKFK